MLDKTVNRSLKLKGMSVASAVLAASLVLTGCTIDRAEQAQETVDTQTSPVAEKALAPVASVSDGATDVSPATEVVVKSLGDGLDEVTMTNEEGKVIQAEIGADGTWHTTEQLGYNRHYTIVAKDKNGESSTTAFSTMTPAATDSASLTPIPDSTVGVGQVIQFHFSTAIQDRQAAQDAITITTEPKVDGAFYWLTATELRWRPKDYWEPGTTVNVEANLYGVDLGGGVYGSDDNSTNFTIGDRVEAVADDATKQMTVYKNGEAVKTMPISMGSNANPTPNGVYTIGDLYPSLLMDSTTYGLALDAGGYRTNVQYASQMSYSGIYVHAAPWSVGSQGVANVSHGCINVSTENAQWFQDFVKRGDLVTVKNTVGGELNGLDGLGDWMIPWETWSAGNA